MIDIIKSEKAFKKYLENYDLDDDRIKLKVTHTYGVVDASQRLAQKLNLSKEDTDLSKLIALLHDIGRFEQTKSIKGIYDNADSYVFDHADYGVKVLFEDGLIREFIEDDSYDEIIKTAILNHNKIKIDDAVEGRALVHSKLIRDNDKMDNFRVKLTENYKVLLGTDDIDFIENEKISDIIYETFMSKKLVNIHDTKTCLDRWIGYIAFIFDIYYNENFEYIKEKDLINRCFDRIAYKNADTIDKITKMKKLANEYINERNCS